jgi:hypothetical protein
LPYEQLLVQDTAPSRRLAGNLIGGSPSTKAEKIPDKSVLWKPCGAGGDIDLALALKRRSW